MIHPSTKVQFLDIATGNSQQVSIENLFNMYASMARYRPNGDGYINFLRGRSDTNESGIKVQDWTGWTDVVKIEKKVPESYLWYDIQVDGQRSLRVTDDEVIPIYDENGDLRGFHGEVKYPYSLWDVTKLHGGEVVRHRKLPGDESEPIQFAPISVKSCKDHACGYILITKSYFYNGNDFHLWGDDAVPLKEVEKWYK